MDLKSTEPSFLFSCEKRRDSILRCSVKISFLVLKWYHNEPSKTSACFAIRAVVTLPNPLSLNKIKLDVKILSLVFFENKFVVFNVSCEEVVSSII